MLVERSIERPVETPSEAGRRRLIAGEGRPLFLADWLRLVFIHYAVDADRLQAEVPFALDDDGYLQIPDKPGLGIEIDHEKLKKYRGPL